MKILIDNGHGSNTPGKCSPYRRYHEWSYTRQIAAAIVRQLKYSGYDADLLVPEDYDVSLCACALSENLFHDNADDLAFLESAPGHQAIIDLHVRGIIIFVNAYSK